MSQVIYGPTVGDAAAGTLLRRVALPASTLTATTYASGLHLPAHAHASAFVLFVREGTFAEEHGRRRERFDRFTCIYRPRLDEHANDFSEGGALLTAIDVHAAWLERLREAGFTDERFSVRSPFVRQFGDRLEAELAAPDSMSEMVIEALATEVIVFGTRRSRDPRRPRPNACAERARRLIESDFAAPLSLTTIAAAVGVHPVHLAREFRAAHACTVGDYIRQIRITYARHQLAATDEPIATIALAAGFADQSQLTKTFKRMTGETPAAYRAVRR